MTTEEPEGTMSIPVDPAADVGSERLAQALAVRDVPAIGQALRHDYVVVPVVRGAAGTRPHTADRPTSRTVAIDLALTADWAVIDLTDPASTQKQAADLVKQQLRGPIRRLTDDVVAGAAWVTEPDEQQ